MARQLLDRWVDRDTEYEFTSQEGITVKITNKSISNKRLRILMMFSRGRKKKGAPMANPIVTQEGKVLGDERTKS
jgi:hypothetical protein